MTLLSLCCSLLGLSGSGNGWSHYVSCGLGCLRVVPLLGCNMCVCAFICMYVYIHVCEARALCTYHTNALISMPGPCNLRIGVAIESRKITA